MALSSPQEKTSVLLNPSLDEQDCLDQIVDGDREMKMGASEGTVCTLCLPASFSFAPLLTWRHQLNIVADLDYPMPKQARIEVPTSNLTLDGVVPRLLKPF